MFTFTVFDVYFARDLENFGLMVDYSSLNDADVLQLISQQEQSALTHLYERYGGPVYSLTLQVLNQPYLAEEATQDTFMKVWHNPHQWDAKKGRFISWLLTVARYTAIDRLRKEQRQPTNTANSIEDMPLPSKTGIPEEQLFRDGQLLRDLIKQLPEDQATVVRMGFFLAMSHSELSQQLDVPLGTVKTRVRLGLKKLRGLWLEANEDLRP